MLCAEGGAVKKRQTSLDDGGSDAVLTFVATKQRVANRGVPLDSFLDERVAWDRQAPDRISVPRSTSRRRPAAD